MQRSRLCSKSRKFSFKKKKKKTYPAHLDSFPRKWDSCSDTRVKIPFLQHLHAPFAHVSSKRSQSQWQLHAFHESGHLGGGKNLSVPLTCFSCSRVSKLRGCTRGRPIPQAKHPSVPAVSFRQRVLPPSCTLVKKHCYENVKAFGSL